MGSFKLSGFGISASIHILNGCFLVVVVCFDIKENNLEPKILQSSSASTEYNDMIKHFQSKYHWENRMETEIDNNL